MSNQQDNELEQLKQLGIEKLVNDTYIAHNIIQAIFDKDFAFFEDKAKAMRFIKIIHSQYDYTMQVWLDEYTQYRKDNNILEEDVNSTINTTNTEYSRHEQSSYTSRIIIGIVVIVAITSAIFLSSSDEQQEPVLQDDNHTSTQQQLQVAISEKINTKNVLSVVPLSNRHKRKQNTKESIDDDLNPEISDLLDRDIVIDLNQSILDIRQNDITITTNLGRIWVGIIDLDTYSKKSDIVEIDKTFPIYDNTIFITGHGHLTLASGEHEYKLANGDKQYFYYKDNSFVKLKRIEYLYLNKGIEW